MIEKICKNCKFFRRTTGPYDTDRYSFCSNGNLYINVKPEDKCKHVYVASDSFEPTCELLLEYWKSKNNE